MRELREKIKEALISALPVTAIVYILAGCLLAKFYDITHHGCHITAEKLPPVAKETVAGLLLGAVATFVPQMMFSGESEIHHLMTDYVEYLPWMLLGIAFLKVLITNICIQFGLKGGHFFPLIYAGVALGYAMAMFIYPGNAAEHVVFAAAVVTASLDYYLTVHCFWVLLSAICTCSKFSQRIYINRQHILSGIAPCSSGRTEAQEFSIYRHSEKSVACNM